MDRRDIIAQLVEARLEKGVSQAELARRIGTQRSNLCRLESGLQNPSLDMILKIADALDKQVSLSLDDKEEMVSNIYSLRIYDTDLMRFRMEKRGLEGLVAEILSINSETQHLMPLDMELTDEELSLLSEGKLTYEVEEGYGYSDFDSLNKHRPTSIHADTVKALFS